MNCSTLKKGMAELGFKSLVDEKVIYLIDFEIHKRCPKCLLAKKIE